MLCLFLTTRCAMELLWNLHIQIWFVTLLKLLCLKSTYDTKVSLFKWIPFDLAIRKKTLSAIVHGLLWSNIKLSQASLSVPHISKVIALSRCQEYMWRCILVKFQKTETEAPHQAFQWRCIFFCCCMQPLAHHSYATTFHNWILALLT